MGTSPKSKAGRDAITASDGAVTDGAGTSGADTGRPDAQASGATQDVNGTRAVIRFACRTDGWLRIAPDGEMKTVYIKWKWTRGVFGNCYVMVRCHHSQIMWGFDLLEQKVEEVELGVRKPVIDSFYQL